MAVFNNRNGNDVFRGTQRDYDQVDYAGRLQDYIFTRNADGSVTVTHPVWGTDTLWDINGFWFSGEAAWYSIDDAIAITSGDDGFIDDNGVITGNDSDNTLTGNNQDNLFYAGMGDDILNGNGGAYNQGEYDGAMREYTFTQNADGSVTMSHPTWGVDTLIDIDGLWFIREQAWYSVEDALSLTADLPRFRIDDDNVLNGTPGNDVMNAVSGGTNFYGGTGNDRYNGRDDAYDQVNYDGNVEDYTIVELTNGSYRITHSVWGTDTLRDIDGLWFNGRGEWYSPEGADQRNRDVYEKADVSDMTQTSLSTDLFDFAGDDVSASLESGISNSDIGQETAIGHDADFMTFDIDALV